MKTQLRSIIKVEIEQVFGRRVVSSRDCIELSDEIYNKTKERLNQNTLRRFFGLVKSEYPPSQSTLSILSKYCGFETLDEAYNIRAVNVEPETTVNMESILHYLISMFKDIPAKNVYDKTFLKLVKHTIQFIGSSEGLADKFQNHIVRTSNGSSLYFEQMVNIDKLNSYYGRAMRYYLKEKGTVEAEVFTNSLRVIQSWLNGEDVQVDKAGHNLLNEKTPLLRSAGMYARYFAAIIMYRNASGENNTAVKTDIKEYFEKMEVENTNSEDLYNYCYVIAEALALTSQYAEAIHYIEKAPKVVTDPNDDQSINYVQSMNLIHSFCLYKIGAEHEAEKVLNTIKPSEFYFLQKKFCNIFFLYLLRELKHNGKKYQEQLLYQIEETGFVRLKTILA